MALCPPHLKPTQEDLVPPLTPLQPCFHWHCWPLTIPPTTINLTEGMMANSQKGLLFQLSFSTSLPSKHMNSEEYTWHAPQSNIKGVGLPKENRAATEGFGTCQVSQPAGMTHRNPHHPAAQAAASCASINTQQNPLFLTELCPPDPFTDIQRQAPSPSLPEELRRLRMKICHTQPSTQRNKQILEIC